MAEEQFTMELHGRVEALQVCLFPGSVIPLLTTNVSRIRSASVDYPGAGRFLLRYLVVPELFCFRELIQYF